MAGKTKIGVGTMGGSFAMAQGWKIIKDYVNANTKYGLFDKEGNPFYERLVEYDSNINFLNSPIKLGGKNINTLTGKIDTGDKSPENKILVEVGVIDVNTNYSAEITKAPLEQGGLLSTNKRQNPVQAQIQYIVTGTDKQRDYFLRALSKAQAGLELFILHCDTMTVQNMNIVGFAVDRNPKTIQLFPVTVIAEQVRNTAKIINPLANATAYSGTASKRGEIQSQPATNADKQTVMKR